MTVALVTGSSTGIGYATALRLAQDGHDVIATMRTPSSSDLAEVANAEGLSLEVEALDVTDDASVAAVFAAHPQVDVLVNNAGINAGGVMEEADIASYEEAMQTNFLGAIRCAKAVLPSMRARRQGCIVNVSSQAGRLAVPTLGPYAASKWALEAAMEALATEVHAFGIRVVLIEPGAIITPILQKTPLPSMESPYLPLYKRFGMLAMHDFGRGSQPEIVADAVAASITWETAKLRWPVGQGAERNISTRAAMSDEQYIETWNAPDDDTFRNALLGDET